MMASDGNSSNLLTTSIWDRPRCLIENRDDIHLEMNEEVLSMLREITDPVVVVTIAGLYRSGKSYLMNRLARQNVFDLGSTLQTKTKGIWVWANRHPTRQNCSLLLIDTEGFGDVEKGDVNYDASIFALAVLLSSALIYNCTGVIDQYSLEKLHFVTKIADRIKMKSNESEDDSAEFDEFFPTFIWAVRDFTLERIIEGKTVTDDEYLEHALQLKSGDDCADYNRPREWIREYFPRRKCFTFSMPVEHLRSLKNLESLDESQLSPEFIQQTDTLIQYLLDSAQTKSVNGININGQHLGALVSCYVDAIRNGAIPCIQSIVDSTARLENERAIRECVELYETRFAESVRLPTETIEELSNCNDACRQEATRRFLKLAVFDDKGIYYGRLMDELLLSYEKNVEENQTLSRDRCQSLLSSLYKPIQRNLINMRYSCPGGYQAYKRDMESLIRRYIETPNKGVMAEELLSVCMEEQEAISADIKRIDDKLTEDAVRANIQKAVITIGIAALATLAGLRR